MEIEITSLIELDAFPLSHSRAEGGQDAGRNTWQASLSQAEETPLLDTPEKLQAMREFARESGGWTAEEIAAWTPQEVNALFLQWVAEDVRQCPRTLETGPFESLTEAYRDACPQGQEPRAELLEEVDWLEYEIQANAGRISGNLYRADDGRIYFYLGF